MLKHAHRCKTKVFIVGVKVGSFDFNPKCQHACNDQWIYTTSKCPLILDLVVAIVSKRKNCVICFCLSYVV